jgi:phosphohistidine phosphatase
VRTLLLMRHAKAELGSAAGTDHDRLLAARGRADAPCMAGWLKQEGLQPDQVLASSAHRAQETAMLVCETLGLGAPKVHASLYMPGVDDILEALAMASGDCVLLVSHNPTCECCIESLTGSREVMPTAGVAVIQFDVDDWSDVLIDQTGTLVQLQVPRALS